MAEPTADVWGIVELLGHRRAAGRCTEQVFAGQSMLRVDTPDPNDRAKFRTDFYSGSAIYSFRFVDEDTARAAAAAITTRPEYEHELEAFLGRIAKRAGAQQQHSLEYDPTYDG